MRVEGASIKSEDLAPTIFGAGRVPVSHSAGSSKKKRNSRANDAQIVVGNKPQLLRKDRRKYVCFFPPLNCFFLLLIIIEVPPLYLELWENLTWVVGVPTK